MCIMETMDYDDYEEEISDEEWCDLVYSEAEAFCQLHSINPEHITHDELEWCADTVANALGFDDDVLIQLEHYWNCFE